MPEDKERKTAIYTIDEYKVSRDYRNTEECRRVRDDLTTIMAGLVSESQQSTACRLSYLIGFLTDSSHE